MLLQPAQRSDEIIQRILSEGVFNFVLFRSTWWFLFRSLEGRKGDAVAVVPGCLASSVLHPSRSLSAMMVLRFLFGEIRRGLQWLFCKKQTNKHQRIGWDHSGRKYKYERGVSPNYGKSGIVKGDHAFLGRDCFSRKLKSGVRTGNQTQIFLLFKKKNLWPWLHHISYKWEWFSCERRKLMVCEGSTAWVIENVKRTNPSKDTRLCKGS